MTRVSRWLVLLACAIAALMVQPNCAYACSCVAPGTPAEELAKSDAVFLGRVVDVKAPTGPIDDSSDVTMVTFETSQVWKGQITQTQTLTTPGSSASCGVTFTPGQEYVVYARVNEGVLTTTLCSRTQLASDATEDITAFGAGQAAQVNAQIPAQLPSTGAAESGDVLRGMAAPLAAFGIAALAAGVALAVISRRRRHGAV